MSVLSSVDTAIGVTRSMLIYYGQPWRRRQLRRFYRELVSPGDLVFDIGAHVGSRSRTLISLENWARIPPAALDVEPDPENGSRSSTTTPFTPRRPR